MKKIKKLIRSCLPLLLAVTLLTGTAQAVLLEVGPTVPQVIGSTVPNLGHGYPSWYRDTNRVPLELCMNEAMCFFAPPDPNVAVSFPSNVPDELFYWAGDASIALASGGNAILVQAIEAAYSTGGVVPGAQITFARMRIRVDTNVTGTYVLTTPFKQYTFNVTDIAAGINFTEDIGIGADGVFTGALTGSVGPFLYCTDAPFPATDGSGGSYIGKNALACPVLGSTFIDPVTNQPANFFRVQGPAGFGGVPSGTVQTADFRVQGKIYTAVTPTPLTVDKAAYVLDTTGLRLSVFATTQALSNQTNTAAAFPLNFALGGAPSVLQLSATGITPQTMTTNTPADGKFFVATGPVAAALPTTVTVTNTADVPATVVNAPLVDEVVISAVAYTPLTKKLAITASSSDKVNAPALQAFMPGMTAPLGTLAAGVLNVTFPVIDTTVIPNKTYAIPPNTITVTSAKGGAATAPVSTLTPVLPATAVSLTSSLPSPQLVGTSAVTLTAAATGGDAGPYEYRFYWRAPNTIPFTMGRPYSTTPTWTWNTAALPAGTYTLMVYARHVGSQLDPEVRSIITFQLGAPVVAATAVSLTPSVPSQTAGAAVTLTAAASGGDAGPYEYRFYWRPPNTIPFTMGRPYSTTPNWTWDTATLSPGTYTLMVFTRHVGSPVDSEVKRIITYVLN